MKQPTRPKNFHCFRLLVIHCWTAPSNDERQEIYLETCQASCHVVKNVDENKECRKHFCSNYVEYLTTGHVEKNVRPTLASTDRKEAEEFCATWLVHLIDQFGWQNRLRLNLKECVCAAGKECLLK